jgi:hypothetical protein
VVDARRTPAKRLVRKPRRKLREEDLPTDNRISGILGHRKAKSTAFLPLSTKA